MGSVKGKRWDPRPRNMAWGGNLDVPAAHFKVHVSFRLGPYIPRTRCRRVCDAEVYECDLARRIKEYVPGLDIAVCDPPFRRVQILDARKDLIDDGLGHHGKCQDTLGVVRHVRISDGGEDGDGEEVGEREGHEGHGELL